MIKNKFKILIFIILIIFILIGLYININILDIDKKHISKEDIIQDIDFEIYSNEFNILKILVVVSDTENGIQNLTLPDQRTINCYNKKNASIDYTIETSGEYKFKAINSIGETFEKTLLINDEYINNLIDINVSSQKPLDTIADITISYNDYNNISTNKTYKIGTNTNEWTTYTGQFSINSYDILNNNLQNSDNQTVTIYAKEQDNANNRVIISKQIVNLDLDIPDEPVIEMNSDSKYATLTQEGVIFNSNVTISFDSRTDITNYYSTDNGNTWNVYSAPFDTNSIIIHAKSVKNDSGLEISSNKTINDILASDALKMEAYDGLDSTYQTIHLNGSYLLVSTEMIGKKFNVDWSCTFSDWHYHKLYLYFKDQNNNILQTESCSTVFWGIRETRTFTIPENTSKIDFYGSADGCTPVYELFPSNE